MDKHTVTVWPYPQFLVERYVCTPGSPEVVAPHAHDDYQLCLSLEAACVYRYRGASHTVARGQLSLMHPGEVHATWDAEARPPQTSYHLIYLRPSLFQKVAEDVMRHNVNEPFFPNPILVDDNLIGLFRSLTRSLEYGGEPLQYEIQLSDFLTTLLTHTAQNRVTLRNIPSAPEAVQRVRAFLHETNSYGVRLEDLAQVAGVSPYHLAHLFRRHVGLSPYAYHLQVRVERAKFLLAHGVSIAQVVQKTGFYDQSRFGRYFKRLVGVTPAQYQVAQDLPRQFKASVQ
ncbi:AraC family transcriptional regulator [Dictyobacter alpinus]|uniref:AraC family transcriptional regulator n=1 Tax=Dictyobacter alpinus TaxID=2014873 RepID=A0A402BBP6_9CHLR|nr:AraC family transcriptional regulator [Dictyobacter alpinus]GCE28697.1 AraC family transcriptional regulator [Dictyobacter alpinus]